MNNRPTVIERAFELARSGTYPNVSQVMQRLKGEGFDSVDSQISGASIRKQLRELCVHAYGPTKPAAVSE